MVHYGVRMKINDLENCFNGCGMPGNLSLDTKKNVYIASLEAKILHKTWFPCDRAFSVNLGVYEMLKAVGDSLSNVW